MRVTCYESENGCHVQSDTKVLVIEICKGNKSDKDNVKMSTLENTLGCVVEKKRQSKSLAQNFSFTSLNIHA